MSSFLKLMLFRGSALYEHKVLYIFGSNKVAIKILKHKNTTKKNSNLASYVDGFFLAMNAISALTQRN